MKSKRSHEGYLLIDHRAGDGMNSIPSAGLDQLPPVPGGSMLERSIITCSHCQAGVIVNPLRMRDRGWCPNCDHYICDSCEAVRVKTGVCRTFKQVIDEALNLAAKGLDTKGLLTNG